MLTHGMGVYTKSTRYGAQTHAVVSLVAAQLIQAPTAISSPPASLAPHPEGSHSVAGHSHPRLWADGQQLGLRPLRRMEGRGRNLRGGKKKGGCKEAEERRKGGGEIGGGHLSHSLSYTKVSSVPVIQEAGVGLRTEA